MTRQLNMYDLPKGLRATVERKARDEALGTVACDYTRGGYPALSKCEAWEPFQYSDTDQLAEYASGFEYQFKEMWLEGFRAGQKARKIIITEAEIETA